MAPKREVENVGETFVRRDQNSPALLSFREYFSIGMSPQPDITNIVGHMPDTS